MADGDIFKLGTYFNEMDPTLQAVKSLPDELRPYGRAVVAGVLKAYTLSGAEGKPFPQKMAIDVQCSPAITRICLEAIKGTVADFANASYKLGKDMAASAYPAKMIEETVGHILNRIGSFDEDEFHRLNRDPSVSGMEFTSQIGREDAELQ